MMKNDDDNRFQTPSVFENNVSFFCFMFVWKFPEPKPPPMDWNHFLFCKKQKTMINDCCPKSSFRFYVENFFCFNRNETKRKFPKRKKIIHRNHHYYGNLFNLWRKTKNDDDDDDFILNLMNFDLEKKKHSFYKLSLMFGHMKKIFRKFNVNDYGLILLMLMLMVDCILLKYFTDLFQHQH